MTGKPLGRFRKELNRYFTLVLLNMAFGALAMASGMQYMVMAVLGQTGSMLPAVRFAAGVFAMVGFGLGLSWVVSSARILEGIRIVRRAVRDCREPVPDEVLTGWIVSVAAHYRGNRDRIRWMAVVCLLGGCVFLALGILAGLEFFSVSISGGTVTINSLLVIPAAALTLGIAAVSLASSYYFSRLAKVWDRRVGDVDRSRENLAEALGGRPDSGQGGPEDPDREMDLTRGDPGTADPGPEEQPPCEGNHRAPDRDESNAGSGRIR